MPEFVRVHADVKTMFLPGQLQGLAGLRIHFDMKIRAGEFLVDSGADRPTLIPWLRAATGYVRSDGRLYDKPAVSAAPHDLNDPGELGVLVPANDPNFNLENAVAYHVSCELPVAGREVLFKEWDITVPSSETSVNLGGLTPGPAQEVMGVPELVTVDMINGAGDFGKQMTRTRTASEAAYLLDGGDVFNWKDSNTRRVIQSMAKAISGTGYSDHLFIGDSETAWHTGVSGGSFASMWPRIIQAQFLARSVPIGGTGWAWPISTGENTYLDPRFSKTGTWTRQNGYYTTSTSGATLTFASDLSGTAISVAYFTSSAAFTVTIDGGAPVTVTPSGAFGIAYYTVNGLSNSTHTVVVTTSTASATYIVAMQVYKSSGARLHNLAIGGALASSGWNQTTFASPLFSARTLMPDPDVVHIAFGVNDLLSSVSVETVISALTTIRNQFPSSNVVLYGQYQPSGVADETWANYVAALHELAVALDCPLVDLYQRSGGYAAASATGLMGDSIHPNATAQADWGRLVANLLCNNASTSSLVLGSTSSTAKPGDYTPTTLEITTALGATPAKLLAGKVYNSQLPSANPDVFNLKGPNTRRLQLSIAKAISGTGYSDHLFIGDSTTSWYAGAAAWSSMWPRVMKSRLLARGIPSGGTGWVGMSGSNTAALDPRIVAAGTWTRGAGFWYIASSGATLTFTSDVASTAIAVAYFTTGAAFTVSVDGGAPVTVTPSGGFAVATYTVTGLSNSTHTVVVTTSTASNTYIAGFQAYNSTGVRLHNLAVAGSHAYGNNNEWNSASFPSYLYVAQQLVPAPDVVHIALGLVDIGIGSTTVSNAISGLTGIRNAFPNSDVILYGQHATSGVADATWASYVAALYSLALSLDCPLVDLYQRSGGYAVANANGLMGDGNHPSVAGQADWGNLAADTVIGAGAYNRAKPVTNVTSSATPAFDIVTCDQLNITAQAAAITSMSSGIVGTPYDGKPITVRIKDNGTARAITWGSSWRAIGVTLPTTTVISKTHYIEGLWNAADSKIDVIRVNQEA